VEEIDKVYKSSDKEDEENNNINEEDKCTNC
jgi:hypothetical protein